MLAAVEISPCPKHSDGRKKGWKYERMADTLNRFEKQQVEDAGQGPECRSHEMRKLPVVGL